jgi:hypothetical protein
MQADGKINRSVSGALQTDVRNSVRELATETEVSSGHSIGNPG